MKNNSSGLKIGIKNTLKVIGLLYAVLFAVGILTYIIPSGSYRLDANGSIINNSFEFTESATRLPWYRWLTAPIESTLFGDGNMQMLQIIAIIMLLGGCFKVLEVSGGIASLVRVLINRFKSKRFLAVWIISFFMMALSSLFGLQEELLILFPIFMSFASAMNWSRETALGFVLITSGIGFTAATFNPFTVGISSDLAGISVTDGLWYRVIIFVALFVLGSLFLAGMAKKDEKTRVAEENSESQIELCDSDKRNTALVVGLFGFVLLAVIVFTVLPGLADLGLGMVMMGVAFLLGTLLVGRILIGSFKQWGKAFLDGIIVVLPSAFIIMTAFSIKYIADMGGILHTLFYYIYEFVAGTSPYFAVIVMYLFVLLVEFFIPGASSKAFLLIPLLTLAPIEGISKTVIVLAYLFGDGYTNVLYPTNGLLMIGLGVANVSYFSWLKRTALLQIALFALSCGFLLLAVFLGI